MHSPNTKKNPTVTGAGSIALKKKATGLHANAACLHHHSLLPLRGRQECRMDDPTQTSIANMYTHPRSPSKCMSETKDQSSFTAPSSTSTPNKIGSGPHYHSSSTDSRHSMTPLDTSLHGSFTYHDSTGMGCGSVNPTASMAGSQQVTSSMRQPHRLFSSTLPPAPDTLSTEQAAEIYWLATEC